MNWAALLSTSLSVHQDSCCCCSVAFSSSNLIQHVQHGGSESPGGVGAERFHVMRPEEPNSVTHASTGPGGLLPYWFQLIARVDIFERTGLSSIQTDLPTSCFCVNVLFCCDSEPHKTTCVLSVLPLTDQQILSSLQFNFSKLKFPQFDSCVSSQPRCRQQQLTGNILFCLQNLL